MKVDNSEFPVSKEQLLACSMALRHELKTYKTHFARFFFLNRLAVLFPVSFRGLSVPGNGTRRCHRQQINYGFIRQPVSQWMICGSGAHEIWIDQGARGQRLSSLAIPL